MNIILFVTFLCAVVWMYQCIQMYMRIVLDCSLIRILWPVCAGHRLV